ncbi:MAG: Conserved secreted protein of unknown function, putative domain, partial [Frankiales bacterium]|nr:Conserved secreted protein of unknown function, putative domain [Frankiales bacterium]
TGTFTGQDQAAWSVTGNANYISLGGEFPKVNGVAEQGLVRFAVSSIAPNKVGPVASTALTPTVTKVGTSVKLTWGTTYDPDNAVLKYSVYRDGTIPVGSTSVDTRFWTAPAPTQTVTDASPPNGTHTYTVVASDSFGNSVTSAKSAAVTITGATTTTPIVFASDSFNRTVTGGLGTADIGGAWTSASTVAAQSVTPGAAKLAMTAGITTTGILTATSQANAVVTSTISFDKIATGGGIYFSLAGRRVNSTEEYRAEVHQLSSGAVTIYITKLDGSSTEVTLSSTVTLPATLAAGAQLDIKFSVLTTAGTTALGLKAWPASGTEPAAFQATATDSSAALQVPASVGLRSYLSGSATSPVTVSVSSFKASQS